MDPVRSATLVAVACALLVVCAWRLGIATADAEWQARWRAWHAAGAQLNRGGGVYRAPLRR